MLSKSLVSAFDMEFNCTQLCHCKLEFSCKHNFITYFYCKETFKKKLTHHIGILTVLCLLSKQSLERFFFFKLFLVNFI